MITAKKLIKLARKWQKLAAIRRRRLTLPQTMSSLDSDDCGSSSTAEKGHFVVYTTDKKRFVLPLNYLKKKILRELFNLAEEEFGLTSDGPITLPCDATFMEYAITLIQQNVAKDIEKALLITIASNRCPSSLYLHHDVRYHRLSILQSASWLDFYLLLSFFLLPFPTSIQLTLVGSVFSCSSALSPSKPPRTELLCLVWFDIPYILAMQCRLIWDE
ncbi:AUXIN-RESPONSIVE FAMILY PROTEIN [Salix purpurea]|uniref:AUXIN-RESPONSIVE FAMILY PROTEIN n=1 Tax=Salix purpurea TaxID=77065 RepID=A0A9Q0WEK4_SALPP|nr:AUXIN-RESPONSIVE FAMILY PROTEIN [Salix purpurea]